MLINRVRKGKMTNFWVKEVWCTFRDYRNDDVFPFSFGISYRFYSHKETEGMKLRLLNKKVCSSIIQENFAMVGMF